MVKTKSGFVLATAFFSGIAALLAIVSMTTHEWVTARGEFNDASSSDQLSTIKYGLFSGTFVQRLGSVTVFEITMTCVVGENACAYICDSSAEARKKQLKGLLRGEDIKFNVGCPQVKRINNIYSMYTPKETNGNDEYEFLNAGLYISTVAFLSISIIFGLLSTVLSLYNTISNPIEVYLSIYGLYIYNGIACFTCLLAICIYGALFGTITVDNVGILYTIKHQMNTSGLAELGYSFWLLLPSFLLYPISIMTLAVRQYLIDQEPEIKIHTTSGEADVGEIMIY